MTMASQYHPSLKYPAPEKPPDICPLVSNPRADCHCAQLTSLRIPLIVDYCAGDYRACPIYWKESNAFAATCHQPVQEEVKA